MRSEIALPVAPRHRGHPDLIVRWGRDRRIPDEPPDGELICERQSAYAATEAPGGFVLRFHGACDICVDDDLRTINVCPDPDFGRELVPVLLVGTVAAFMLTVRGHTVLHGAAVRHDHATIGIVGPSGIGKSTLAALCCALGAVLISDDVVVLSLGTIPSVVGGWPELRIRPEAAGVIDLFPSTVNVRTTADGRLALQPMAGDFASRLDALVFPQAAERLAVRRVGTKDALLSLLTAERVQGWCRADWQQRQFTALADVAAMVPCYTADVPWGSPFRVDAARALLDAVTADGVGS